MRPTERAGPGLEIVEVGGQGGVFQHAVAVAQAAAGAGRWVRVHTTADHEDLESELSWCHCFRWHRERRRLRSALIVAGFVLRTVPHLVSRSRSTTVWVQGTFKPALTTLLLLCLRLVGRTTVLSPHNLFARSGSMTEARLIGCCVRLANHVVAYNDVDHRRLLAIHPSSHRLPLVQFAHPVPPDLVERWRAALPADRPIVCAIGQIRADKNLPLLIEGATRAGAAVVVMGPDLGGLDEARRRAERCGAAVEWRIGYQPLVDVGAVLVVSGVVVCPYAVASQSGVAALAHAYGAVVVASDVGGLQEQADIVLDELSPHGVARAIGEALARERWVDDQDGTSASREIVTFLESLDGHVVTA